MNESRQVNIGVGMPAWLYLNLFGSLVNDVFDSWPYLVGSATWSKRWRDIDVRLILSDDEYEHWVGKIRQPESTNRRWVTLNMAFSALGERITGLPIDFQIQQMTYANQEYGTGIRCALIGHDVEYE